MRCSRRYGEGTTEDEAREIYDIAWQAYLGVQSLASQLGKAGDDEGSSLAYRWSKELWERLAAATGQPGEAAVDR